MERLWMTVVEAPWRGYPAAALALLGLVLAALTRLVNRWSSRRRGRAARRALHSSVEAVARELVLYPLEAELDAQRRLGAALETAAAEGRVKRRATSAGDRHPPSAAPRLAAPGGAGSRAPR